MKIIIYKKQITMNHNAITNLNYKKLLLFVKNVVLAIIVIVSTNNALGQGNNFKTDGNANLNNSTFLGSTNAAPITFKTNNIVRGSFSTVGNFTLNSLNGTNTALVQTDANGLLSRFNFSGNANEVLFGNGIWGTIPPQSYWDKIGNDIYYNHGNVAIGMFTVPTEKLDVNGNIRATGTVYANGGLVVGTFKQGTAIVTTALGVGTLTPTEKVDVLGNIKASGTIYSNFFQTDSIHVTNRIKIGNSIYLGTTPLGTENNIYANDGDLILQSEQNMSACPTYNTIINANNNGKVGIGTVPALDLGLKLHVKGFTCSGPLCTTCGGNNPPAGESTIFRLEDQVTGNITRSAWWDFVASGVNHKLFIKAKSTDGLNAYVMSLTEGGNVGIGITNPAAKLEVQGSVSIYDGNGNTSLFFGRETVSDHILGKWGVQYQAQDILYTGSKGGLNFWIPFASGNTYGNNYLFLADDGNIGIGTANPENKLDVCGTIRSKEWIVETNGWCDYVFDSFYKRKTWQEKENYLIANRHMFGVDPASEVEKTGLQVGKNIKGIVLNVEENTLDIIDLYKLIEQQNKKMEQLEKENLQLKNQIEKIKKQ